MVLEMSHEHEYHFSNNFTCQTCISKKTKCKPICMSGSSFMHVVTNKCIQKQYHVKKEKDYQRFMLYPGNEGSKHHRQSTGGCVRLAPATSLQQLHSSFLLLSNIVYSKGEHWLSSASEGKNECKGFVVDWAISI
jgi:hypothetical protein